MLLAPVCRASPCTVTRDTNLYGIIPNPSWQWPSLCTLPATVTFYRHSSDYDYNVQSDGHCYFWFGDIQIGVPSYRARRRTARVQATCSYIPVYWCWALMLLEDDFKLKQAVLCHKPALKSWFDLTLKLVQDATINSFEAGVGHNNQLFQAGGRTLRFSSPFCRSLCFPSFFVFVVFRFVSCTVLFAFLLFALLLSLVADSVVLFLCYFLLGAAPPPRALLARLE